jgi:hypothetical protein
MSFFHKATSQKSENKHRKPPAVSANTAETLLQELLANNITSDVTDKTTRQRQNGTTHITSDITNKKEGAENTTYDPALQLTLQMNIGGQH